MNGKVTLLINDEERHVSNVMTTAGKEFLASTLAAKAQYTGEYMGVGTGATAADAADTALEAEVGTRVQGTLSASGAKYTLECTFGSGNPATQEALTEAGLFSAATGGTMIARTTFPVLTKQTTDSIRLVWEITIN